MNTGIISARYAKALLEFAKDKGVEQQVYDQSKVLARSLMEFPKVREALDNPTLTDDKKFKLISVAAGDKVSKEFERFVRFLLKQKRANHLQSICMLYQDLYLKSKNIQHISLATAVEIDVATQDRIREMAQKYVTGVVTLDSEVNSDLIGGFVASWDTYRMDASVRGQLQRIEKSLVKNNK